MIPNNDDTMSKNLRAFLIAPNNKKKKNVLIA